MEQDWSQIVSELRKSVEDMRAELSQANKTGTALAHELELASSRSEVYHELLALQNSLSILEKKTVVLKAFLDSVAFKTGRFLVHDLIGLLLRSRKSGPWAPEMLVQTKHRIRKIIPEISRLSGLYSSTRKAQRLEKMVEDVSLYRAEVNRNLCEVELVIRDVIESKSFRLGHFFMTLCSPVLLSREHNKIKLLIELEYLHKIGDPVAESLDFIDIGQDRYTGAKRGTIIVCVHNAYQDVYNCLSSLVKTTNLRRHSVVLVDDGSQERTSSLLRSYALDYNMHLVRNETARGYTCAANQGLELARGDFAALLNSDTITTRGWLDKLIECAFSRDDVGVVGPLSNAASWQSILELTDEDGRWKINEVPDGYTVEEFAEHINNVSARLFPKVPLVNGFCYFITRDALNVVGKLDEESFPQGYGEEDDFSLRALDMGFVNLIADHCYVYHAKSKSFGSTRRTKIVEQSKLALRSKHGKDRLRKAVDEAKCNEGLVKARTLVLSDVQKTEPLSAHDRISRTPLRIGWIKPHLNTVGGVRRAIEMTNRLVGSGHDVSIITADGRKTSWLPIWSRVISIADLKRQKESFDVLIVSDPDMIEPFLDLPSDLKVVFHLAAYMLYREKSSLLDLYYEETKNFLHIANSGWTAEQVVQHTGVDVSGVFPGGINRALFYPRNTEKKYDLVYYGSTRQNKGSDKIISATQGLSRFSLADSRLQQGELSVNICSGRVFVSACACEGFNFCPLEAMACGVPVVMTDDGGSREYARHEENAFIVENDSTEAIRGGIDRLLTDSELRCRMISSGLATARLYEWKNISDKFEELLLKRSIPKHSSYEQPLLVS